MIHFFFEMVRGVLVGLLCGYLIRPEAKIFTQIEDAVANSSEMVEQGYFELMMTYAPEYLVVEYQIPDYWINGGIGALFGIGYWLLRRKKPQEVEESGKKRKAQPTRKRKKSPKLQTA